MIFPTARIIALIEQWHFFLFTSEFDLLVNQQGRFLCGFYDPHFFIGGHPKAAAT